MSCEVKLIGWQSDFCSCWINSSGNRVSGQQIKEGLEDTVNMYLCCSSVDCTLRENNRCIPSLYSLCVCLGSRNELLRFCCSQTLIQTRNATSCCSFCLQRNLEDNTMVALRVRASSRNEAMQLFSDIRLRQGKFAGILFWLVVSWWLRQLPIIISISFWSFLFLFFCHNTPSCTLLSVFCFSFALHNSLR